MPEAFGRFVVSNIPAVVPVSRVPAKLIQSSYTRDVLFRRLTLSGYNMHSNILRGSAKCLRINRGRKMPANKMGPHLGKPEDQQGTQNAC